MVIAKVRLGFYYDYIEENNRHPSLKADREEAHDAIPDNDAPKEPLTGKSGRAGGTFTDKNVLYTRKGDSSTSQLFTGERIVRSHGNG